MTIGDNGKLIRVERNDPGVIILRINDRQEFLDLIGAIDRVEKYKNRQSPKQKVQIRRHGAFRAQRQKKYPMKQTHFGDSGFCPCDNTMLNGRVIDLMFFYPPSSKEPMCNLLAYCVGRITWQIIV